METDRGAVLTVRAAVRGTIDFSQARLLDPDWWRRCLILLNGVAAEDDIATYQTIYRYHLALVGNSGLSEDSFRDVQDRARDAFNDLMQLYRPWSSKVKASHEIREEEAQQLREAYKQAFGFDVNDTEEEQRRLNLWLEEIKNQKANELEDTARIIEEATAQAEEIRAERLRQRRQRLMQGR